MIPNSAANAEDKAFLSHTYTSLRPEEGNIMFQNSNGSRLTCIVILCVIMLFILQCNKPNDRIVRDPSTVVWLVGQTVIRG